MASSRLRDFLISLRATFRSIYGTDAHARRERNHPDFDDLLSKIEDMGKEADLLDVELKSRPATSLREALEAITGSTVR